MLKNIVGFKEGQFEVQVAIDRFGPLGNYYAESNEKDIQNDDDRFVKNHQKSIEVKEKRVIVETKIMCFPRHNWVFVYGWWSNVKRKKSAQFNNPLSKNDIYQALKE